MFIHVFGMCLALIGMAESRLPSLATHASMYAAAGELEKAIEVWSLLLAVAPEQEGFWFGRGMSHGMLGNTEAMHHDMAKAFSLVPATALAEYYYIDDEDDSDETEAQYQEIIQKYPHCAMLKCAATG